MNIRSLRRLTLLLLLLSLQTSCGYLHSYRIIEPDRPSLSELSTEKPLQLIVGLSGTEEILLHEHFHLKGKDQELKAYFAQRLQDHTFFQRVLYPITPHDQPQLDLRVSLKERSDLDTSAFPKLFLLVLLYSLPAPFLHLEHHFVATGELEIIRQNHLVRKYTAKSDVTAWLRMLADPPPTFWQEVASRARDAMITDLLYQLSQDRAFFSQFEEK